MYRALKSAALAAVVLATGCAQAPKSALLRLDTRLIGGRESQARIDVPGEWYQLGRRPDRADFTGPDNFSNITFFAAPTTVDGPACGALARRAAEDVAADLARQSTKSPEFKANEAGDDIEFRISLTGTAPQASDRTVVGRVHCGEGGLATVTCSVGVNRTHKYAETCQKVLASLQVKALAPAVETSGTKQAPPAPGMDKESQPAAPQDRTTKP